MERIYINIDNYIRYSRVTLLMNLIVTIACVVYPFTDSFRLYVLLLTLILLITHLFFYQKHCKKNILEKIESKLEMMNREIRTSKFYFNSGLNFYFIALTFSQEIFLFYYRPENLFSSSERPSSILFGTSDLENVYKDVSTTNVTKLNKKTLAKNTIAGGLMFGTRGALAGSLLTKDKTTQTYATGWVLKLSFKENYLKYKLPFDFNFDDIDKWYLILNGKHTYYSKKGKNFNIS